MILIKKIESAKKSKRKSAVEVISQDDMTLSDESCLHKATRASRLMPEGVELMERGRVVDGKRPDRFLWIPLDVFLVDVFFALTGDLVLLTVLGL